MKRLLVILTLVIPLRLCAQSDMLSAGGYVRDLSGWVAPPPAAPALSPSGYQNILHARLNLQSHPLRDLTLAAGLRTRLIYQKAINLNDSFSTAVGNDGGLVDLTLVAFANENAVLVCEVDRLFADWNSGAIQATVGRQRIAWGTALVWNPTDLFNPFSVLDFDYEERPGVDAVRVQYFTGPTSRVEIAVAPGTASREAVAAGLVHVNVAEYDVNLLGGAYDGGYVVGFSWAGQIADGGFRGEVRYTGGQTAPEVALGETDRHSYVLAALSGDYTFPSSFTIRTEVLLNGDGVADHAGLRWPAALALGQFSPARYSLYQEFAYNLSALVRAGVYALINPLDGSFIAVPSVTWSLWTDWDLYLIALLPDGEPTDEFGVFGASAFLRLSWSF